MQIDLSMYKGNRYKVLSGAEFGEAVRADNRLDDEDSHEGVVTFYIPDNVYSLNSSFFSGLFQRSIRTLGESKFREKYKFSCSEVIQENIEDGIFNIVNTLNLMGKDQ